MQIPDRLLEFEDDDHLLSPDQLRVKQQKISAIETMLTRTGLEASDCIAACRSGLVACRLFIIRCRFNTTLGDSITKIAAAFIFNYFG